MRRGYTLIEILVVVAVLGIAAAIVVPGLMRGGQMGIQAAARMVVADVIYMQNDAVARQAERRIVFEPELNRYRLLDENGDLLSTDWRVSGGESGGIVDLEYDRRFSGVRIESASFGSEEEAEIRFDDVGSPDVGGTVVLMFDDMRYIVRIARFTGRVTIEKDED